MHALIRSSITQVLYPLSVSRSVSRDQDMQPSFEPVSGLTLVLRVCTTVAVTLLPHQMSDGCANVSGCTQYRAPTGSVIQAPLESNACMR